MGAFTHELRVRWHECDPQGIVFNAHYVAFFDITLTELWRVAFDGASYAAMIRDFGVDMVVGEIGVRFFASARFDDVLGIEARITRLGTTGMTTEMTVRRGEETLVEGTLRHVFVDPRTMAKTPIPEGVRAQLERFAG
jgi:acyl-CoA thioester hydrolase